jgi:uncharacterized protein (TIGR00288 family)
MNSDQKLAILIDGDNIPAKYVNEMLQETTKYGTPTIKRIYGDWTNPRLNKWKGILLDNAITPIQQYAYTIGKNATDSAMIIDAMDILYSGKVDGFCLVSSDSDFTRLATRLREAGMTVIGIGEKKTPEPFLAACNRFVYLEILQSQENEEEETNGAKPKRRKTKGKQNLEKLSKKDIQFIAATISDVAADDGWAFMGDVGSMLQKKRPSFDSRNYGFQKLTPLINSADRFEIEQRENHGDRFKLIYVRDRESAIK